MSALVYRPAPATHGFKAVVGGHVIPARDLAAAAHHLLSAREAGTTIEVFARITLTRERPLTIEETGTLVRLATELAS